MLKKITLVGIISLKMVLSGIAQDDKAPKISVFKPEDTTPVNAGARATSQLQHCIKWNYSLLGRGVFMLNYENAFQKKLTFEGGLGVTYRDFIFEASRDYFYGADLDNAKFGVAVEGGIRFYPAEVIDFEGFYLSPMLSYRTYRLPDGSSSSQAYTTTTPPYVPTSAFKEGYNCFDMQLKIGYAYESWMFDDIVADIYAGVGIRTAKMQYYEETSVMTPVGSGSSYSYVATTKTFKIPQFLFGFKIGVPF